MRANKKQRLLEVAIGIIDDAGLSALTYESLASASGMSKSGLIYHFPSRFELLLEINRYLASNWEERMVEVAGGHADEVSARKRLLASFIVMSQSATLTDLRVGLEASIDHRLREPWLEVQLRWSIHPDSIEKHPQLYLLQVLADGLWVHDHVTGVRLDDQQRHLLIDAALSLFDAYLPPDPPARR